MLYGVAGVSPPFGASPRARRLAQKVWARTHRRLHETTRQSQLTLPTTGLVGMVEDFARHQVTGWVTGPAALFPVRITLHLNEVEVAATWADHPSRRNTLDDARGFRFAIADLWSYCQAGDRLTVRMNGSQLAIAGRGAFRKPGESGPHTLADLQRRFDSGYLFGQTGRLQLSKKYNTAWQTAVLDLYERVCAIVESTHGYQPFVIYGTLLGLVRERGFIGHDVDFDAAYLSRHRTGQPAAAELRDIGFALIEHGLDVSAHRSALHIRQPGTTGVRIDLFHLYANDELRFPFGIAGTTRFTRADWAGLEADKLAGRTVRRPGNAERLVEHIYGSAWRTPIPGFHWNRARTAAASDGWLPRPVQEEVYWANFYARHESSAPSSFFATVNTRDDVPAAVLDIGCGDGRDSLGFAAAGRRVLGLDRSQVAVDHATDKARGAGLADVAAFQTCDVGSADDISAAVAAARQLADGGAVLFYFRFFLHSIPEETQQALLDALAGSARAGDMFAAEFRSEQDEETPKTYGRHYRRYQNGSEFGRTLAGYGFRILDEKEGQGLAPFGDEDPVLYRVIATFR